MSNSIKTPYGTVELTVNPDVRVYRQTDRRKIMAQGPFLRAWKVAERRFYVATTPKWKRIPFKVRHIWITGVGYREFDYQAALHASDPDRYASPYKSLHVKALAADVNQNQDDLPEAEKALRSVGFKDGAAFGDPPHWSYPIAG